MTKQKLFIVYEEGSAQTLLKEATARKKAGDIEGAIDLLRTAYAEIDKSGEQWPVSPFFRLPMYLQEVGREDEAWQEFNLLISKGHPGQRKDKGVVMMEDSLVYDKMRLFLQRAKKPEMAVKFGILAYLSWTVGLYIQGWEQELEDYISWERLEATIRKLLRKAKREDLLEQVCNIVEEGAKQLPHVDIRRLSEKVDELVLCNISFFI